MTRRTIGERLAWLAGAGVLVGLVLAVLQWTVAHFDAAAFKPALLAAVQSATGRTLHLNGPVHLVRGWRPRLELTDATLDNLPGGTRPDMARIERITVELALPALLQRQVEITALTLVGPNILFEQVDGRPNWQFDLPGQPTAEPGAYQLRIRTVHIQNGMVTWRLPARTKVLGIRALDVAQRTDDGPLRFDGTFVYSDNAPFQVTGTALPKEGHPLDNYAEPWKLDLALNAFDTSVTATGTADIAANFDLQLEATIGALDKLNALLPEMQLPAVQDLRATAHLTNGLRPGDLPTIGATKFTFAQATMAPRLPGLVLGATTVTVDRPGGTATVDTTATYAGQAFALTGTTTVPVHPDEPATLAIDLTATSPTPAPARFTATIKGALALQALAFDRLDADATLTTPALAALRPLAPAVPALTALDAAAHLVIPTAADTVAFSNARLKSAEGDLEGDGTLGLGPTLAVSGDLRSTRLDLDAMLAAFGLDLAPPGSRATIRGPVIPTTPIAWPVLRGPAVNLAMDAERLTFLGEDWSAVALGLDLDQGQLRRFALNTALNDRPVSLAVTADANRGSLTLAASAPAIPLALVARYAGLPGRVTGTAALQARLSASGNTLHALATTLDGTVSLANTGGRLTNAAFIQLTGASLDALQITVPRQGTTVLRCLGIAANFENGIGQLAPIALETTHLALAGQGRIDLRREYLDLRLKPLARVSGSMVEVPVVVQGPFRNLSGRLDADLFDKLGLFVDGLFGGDTPTACLDAGLLR